MKATFKGLLMLFMALVVQIAFAQEKTVTGTVTDPSGAPLAGVNITIAGSSKGAHTNFDGEYSIEAEEGQTLSFSSIGFKDQSITIGSDNVINLQMEEGSLLDEVVVVAYGSQTKESLTGSVGEVKSEDIAKITSANAVQGMTGKVAGVQVFSGNGLPGEAPTVRFRGVGSINGSSAPLYVVDGVPFTGSISSINNNDIESMTFLKDAAATSLYGNRAANGVIIITTKQAKKGETKYNVEVKTGIAKRGISEYDLSQDIPGFYEYYYNILKNDYLLDGISSGEAHEGALADLISGPQGLAYNVTDVANGDLIGADGRFNPNANVLYQEDWKKYLFDTGIYTNTFFNAANSKDGSSLYYSVGYENNETYMVNSRWEKATARFKGDSEIGNHLKVGGNLAYSYTRSNRPDGFDGGTAYSNPFQWTRHIAPIYPVHAYDDSGKIITLPNGDKAYDDGTGKLTGKVRKYGEWQNPYATALHDVKLEKTHQIFAGGFATVNILDGLDFTYKLTSEYRGTRGYDMDTPLYGDAVEPNGRLRNYSRSINSINQQQLLEYDKKINDFRINALVAHETYKRDNDFMRTHVTNGLLVNSIYSDMYATLKDVDGYATPYALESYFGRLNVDYDRKYYLSGSWRRDGSSRFHPDRKWGNFYSVGASWIISNEDFFNSELINSLKLKASYGEVGNDDLGYSFPYLDLFSVVQTTEDVEFISYNQTFKGNPEITWEKNKNFNAGVEISLLDDRISLDVEYFQKKTNDLLYMRPLPLSQGFASMPENIGDMQNKGFEVTLNADVIRTEDVRLNLFANATNVKNKILKLPESKEGHLIDGSRNRILKPGGEMHTWYLREFAGVNSETGAAQWTLIDKETGEKGVTEEYNDATRIDTEKSSLPDVYGGFGFNLDVKGFDLSVNFAYQFGGYGYDSQWTNMMSGGIVQNFHQDYYQTWSFDNTSAELPIVLVDDPNLSYATSTIGLIKSDYVSLQNVSLGYTFDQRIIESLGLSSLRVSVLGDNLHVWSKRKGYDPRQFVGGTNQSNYSPIATYSLGINLSF